MSEETSSFEFEEATDSSVLTTHPDNSQNQPKLINLEKIAVINAILELNKAREERPLDHEGEERQDKGKGTPNYNTELYGIAEENQNPPLNPEAELKLEDKDDPDATENPLIDQTNPDRGNFEP